MGVRRPGRLGAPRSELLDRGDAASGEPKGGAGTELVVPCGAAYELGMRERDHGIEIQPYPDG
jgi:hypothetical protein